MIVSALHLLFGRACCEQLDHVIDDPPVSQSDDEVIKKHWAFGALYQWRPWYDVLLATVCDSAPPLAHFWLAEPCEQCGLFALAGVEVLDLTCLVSPPAVAVVAEVSAEALTLFGRPSGHWCYATGDVYTWLTYPRRAWRADLVLTGEICPLPVAYGAGSACPHSTTEPAWYWLWKRLTVCLLRLS